MRVAAQAHWTRVVFSQGAPFFMRLGDAFRRFRRSRDRVRPRKRDGLRAEAAHIDADLRHCHLGREVADAGMVVSISKRHHDEYLAQLGAGALRRRAESLYQELEVLQQLRRQAKRDLVVECGKYPEAKLLCSVPFLGPARAAVLIGRVQTPHRFRTKRQFWAYCGLALETRDSGEFRMVNGQVERRKRPAQIRGLNWNHNHELKNLFKAAGHLGCRLQGSVSRVLSWVSATPILGCSRKICSRRRRG